MTILLIALLLVIVLALFLDGRIPESLRRVVLVVAILGAVAVIFARNRPIDIAKPYQVVFRGSGYGLARLLVDSGAAPGPVLVLLPGDGDVDAWRVAGLDAGVNGSGFTISGRVTLPVDRSTETFAKAEFRAALSEHTDVHYIIAFSGLPGEPNPNETRRFVVLHPTDATHTMAAWWKAGRLIGVLAPRLGEAPTPNGREQLAAAVDAHFVRRTTNGSSSP
ncbi:MAG TPA: hypothetical protein PKE12_07450 [Kiritimatiellia bacterium]|nr:hypothetical protein [Kiritimatiellia bacterium]